MRRYPHVLLISLDSRPRRDRARWSQNILILETIITRKDILGAFPPQAQLQQTMWVPKKSCIKCR